MDVDIVETAPHNYGHTGKYQGVGGGMLTMERTSLFEDIADYAKDGR